MIKMEMKWRTRQRELKNKKKARESKTIEME